MQTETLTNLSNYRFWGPLKPFWEAISLGLYMKFLNSRNLMISFSGAHNFFLPLVSVYGIASSLDLQQQAAGTRHPKYVGFLSVPESERLISVPWAAVWRARTLVHMLHSSLSPQGRSGEPEHSLLALSCAALEEGLTWVKWNCSYLFRCNCALLFAHLGYCNFLTEFWKSHECILVCILLLNQCF